MNTAVDSIQITLENLRFISESYRNLISTIYANEWTIFISFVSFFIILSGYIMKSKQFLKEKCKLFLFLIFLAALAVIGIAFSLDLHCGYQKDTEIYFYANNQIISELNKHNLVDSLMVQNLNRSDMVFNKPYFGGWVIFGLQTIVISIFALMTGIIAYVKRK